MKIKLLQRFKNKMLKELKMNQMKVIRKHWWKLALEEDLNVSARTNYEVVFNNPLEVKFQGYTYPKPQKLADGSSRNIRGIDIKLVLELKLGCSWRWIKEVANKVEDGTYIVIAHANGLYTNIQTYLKKQWLMLEIR